MMTPTIYCDRRRVPPRRVSCGGLRRSDAHLWRDRRVLHLPLCDGDELQDILDRLNHAWENGLPMPEIVKRPEFDFVKWMEDAGMFDRRPSLWE